MARKSDRSDPAQRSVALGERAQMEQIHQSLARVASQAAKLAAKETLEGLFTALGYDVSKPEGIIRLNQTLTFAGDMMEARNIIKRQGIKTVVALAVTAMIGALALGFRNKLGLPALAAAIILIAFTPTPVDARWKAAYASQPQEVRDWYESRELTPAAQERFHFKSCCNNADVVKTKFKVGGKGNDEWFWLEGETWRRIPDDVIHWDEHAPSGQPVMFAVAGMPVCFFPAQGGI